MFVSVQILRGIAASMVVCFHYVGLQAGRGAEVGQWLGDFGVTGVDIFFVISGFIMMVSQPDAGAKSAKSFLLRRFVRIAPLYWALTLAAFFLTSLFAPSGITARLGVKTLAMSMLFLPHTETYVPMSRSAIGTYILPMAWTLTYEWFFYLLFALALALGLRSYGRLLFLGLWFGCCMVIGLIFQPAPLVLQMVTSPLPFEFLLGCVVAILYAKGVRLSPMQAFVTASSAAIVLANSPGSSIFARSIIWGGAAFLLVAAATLAGGDRYAAKLRPLARLGDISYSLYLSHWFSVALFPKLQARIDLLNDGFGIPAIFAFVVLTVAIAELCYRLVEEPARVFAAKIRRQRAAA